MDIAISPDEPLTLDDRIPIAIEMKLGANCYTGEKMAAIQSDISSESHFCDKEGSLKKCYFVSGRREELDGLSFPGLSKDDEQHVDKYQYCTILLVSSYNV